MWSKNKSLEDKTQIGVVITRRDELEKLPQRTFVLENGSIDGPLSVTELEQISAYLKEIDPTSLFLDGNLAPTQDERVVLARGRILRQVGFIDRALEAYKKAHEAK